MIADFRWSEPLVIYASDTAGATGEPFVMVLRGGGPPDPRAAELREMAAESEAYWTRREAERLEGHRLAERAVRRRPEPPRSPVRPRRHEPRRWTQAVRAFRGRAS